MRVCIVGGGGFLGCELAARLQSTGAHTVLLDVSFPEHTNIKLDERLTTIVQGSVLDEEKVCEALRGCESCFHIAAYGMSGIQAFNRDLIFRINVDGTLLLMSCCKRFGISRFVYTSSVGVIFVGKELVNASETYPYPKESEYFSWYSASKARAEKLVLASNCAELRTCALRLRGIFGPGEPRSTDRAADMIHKGFFIATFAEKGKALTQYSGIYNVTQAMYKADMELAKPRPRCAGKVYHIVDDEPVDSFMFWAPLIKALSQSPPFLRLPFPLIYFFAYLTECLAVWFGIPPLLNRLEVALIGVTNTYSIEAARKDLDYKPTNNHDLTEVVDYYKKLYQSQGSRFSVRFMIKALCIVAIFLFLLFRFLL
ncbi:unnamed protein product [Cylicocyclus nassatus]|uniref:3-beta hydroxysteroid dehydrogenase/isomerase domain-containing protein n=1 Tax=Cylicocyclus nassatus TaxID=53992 RepID=A0AA36H967_CYLNA|nr:unnamed protein product [Cylicocyclus nassatus]